MTRRFSNDDDDDDDANEAAARSRDARVAELFGLPAEALNVERAILTKLATKDIK